MEFTSSEKVKGILSASAAGPQHYAARFVSFETDMVTLRSFYRAGNFYREKKKKRSMICRREHSPMKTVVLPAHYL
jgi:hypothetical protein